jgi:hypothetical protein
MSRKPITELPKLVKILNDLRDCFSSISNDFNDPGDCGASTVVDVAFDIANDEPSQEDFQEYVNSEIFQFNDEEKSQFIKDARDGDKTRIKFYEQWGAQRAQILLETAIDIPLTVVCDGGYGYDVTSFKITIKSGISVRDFYLACVRFMEHDMHSIGGVEIVEGLENTIRVIIDEST